MALRFKARSKTGFWTKIYLESFEIVDFRYKFSSKKKKISLFVPPKKLNQKKFQKINCHPDRTSVPVNRTKESKDNLFCPVLLNLG